MMASYEAHHDHDDDSGEERGDENSMDNACPLELGVVTASEDNKAASNNNDKEEEKTDDVLPSGGSGGSNVISRGQDASANHTSDADIAARIMPSTTPDSDSRGSVTEADSDSQGGAGNIGIHLSSLGLGPGAYRIRTSRVPSADEDEENPNPAPTTDGEAEDGLIEAYTVLDDDEQAGIIDDLHQQLGTAKQQLDAARTQLAAPVIVAESVVPMAPKDEGGGNTRRKVVISSTMLLATMAAVVGVYVYFARSVPPTDTVSESLPPVLEALKERRVLRCGVVPNTLGGSRINETTNEREGFEIDLCKAVAAASLGSSYRYETIIVTPVNRFVTLASGEVDLIIAGTTHTFDRDVYQASAGTGFSFSTPYLYGGMTFGGVPEFVECADKLSAVGDCANLMICVIPGTTWMDKTEELFPKSNFYPIEEQGSSIESLKKGECNVIEGEQYEAPEVVVRLYGYDGPYAQGSNIFTKEPLGIMTRDGDPEFADFVNWVVESLLYAEAENITMQTADAFTKTGLFGDQFENMFQNALAAVGNYGEIYARHFEPIAPRLKVNMINNGNTGLLYSYPFGQVNTIGPGPIKGGVIESILQRGFLRCGIPLRDPKVLEDVQVGISSDGRVGLAIQFCRALSASILKRVPDNISFQSFPETSEYKNISLALVNGDIDVYAGGEMEMSGDAQRLGLSFSKPYFYETPKENSTAGKAFSLVTKEGDVQWNDFVSWIVMATFDAEENDIMQATSNEMPLVGLFGPDLERMLRDAILAVGNYGEMYRRVFGQNASRVGRNMLNDLPFDAEHYPLPFGNYPTDES